MSLKSQLKFNLFPSKLLTSNNDGTVNKLTLPFEQFYNFTMHAFYLTELVVLFLNFIGFFTNGTSLVHVVRSFDLKTHVFTLVFVDAVISTICCAASVVLDILVNYSLKLLWVQKAPLKQFWVFLKSFTDLQFIGMSNAVWKIAKGINRERSISFPVFVSLRDWFKNLNGYLSSISTTVEFWKLAASVKYGLLVIIKKK